MDGSASIPQPTRITETPSAPSTYTASETQMTMLRPPLNRGLKVLDRSLFKTTFPLASATVFEAKNISRIKNELMKSKDIMHEPGIMAVRSLQDIRDRELDIKRKCVLLRQGIKAEGMSADYKERRGC